LASILGDIRITCKKEVRRWDNAPHWKNIKTFPYHAHDQNVAKPFESPEVFIEDVLQYLKEMIQ